MKQNAVIEHLKQKKTMTPAEREENQRFVSKICGRENEEIFLLKVSFWSALGRWTDLRSERRTVATLCIGEIEITAQKQCLW